MDKRNLLEDTESCEGKEDLASNEATSSVQTTSSSLSAVCVCMGRQWLSFEEREVISEGQCLTDNHMNYIQDLIQVQVTTIRGLLNTLLVSRPCACTLAHRDLRKSLL